MKNHRTWIALLLLAAIGISLSACGGGSSSDTATPVGSESVYEPGAPVSAVGFSEAATITLFQDSGSGMLQIGDGALVTGSSVRLGVQVTGGTRGAGRVFLSDITGRQVEATKSGAYYVCDFPIDTEQLIVPVLVQVIYDDGLASKEKFMLRTRAGAANNQLVRDGLGVLIGKDILASAKGMSLEGLTIDELIPATAYWRNGFNAVLRARLDGLENVPVGIALVDGIKDGTTDAVSPTLKLNIDGLLPIDMGALTLPIADMVGGMADDLGADLSGLNFDKKPVFLDVHGLPGATTDNAAALAMGIFTATGVSANSDSTYTFPSGVTLYPNNNQTHPALNLNVSQLGTNPAKCIGANLSMDNMTQFLGTLLDGAIVMDAASLPIPLAIPGYEKNSAINQTMKITIKKQGVAFDFRTGTPRLMINDLRMEYRENDKPKWQMSLDLCFTLSVGAHTGSVTDPATGATAATNNLDLYLTLVPELSACHVMKDDLGIGIFDHSDFAALLVDALKEMLPADKTGTDLMVSIDLQEFGINLTQATAASDAGRCFLKMTTDGANLAKVADAGLCFINSAR